MALFGIEKLVADACEETEAYLRARQQSQFLLAIGDLGSPIEQLFDVAMEVYDALIRFDSVLAWKE